MRHGCYVSSWAVDKAERGSETGNQQTDGNIAYKGIDDLAGLLPNYLPASVATLC